MLECELCQEWIAHKCEGLAEWGIYFSQYCMYVRTYVPVTVMLRKLIRRRNAAGFLLAN